MICGAYKPSYPFTVNRECRHARGLIFWYADALTGGIFMLDHAGYSNSATLATNGVGTVPNWGFGKDGGHAVNLPGSPGNRIVPRVPLTNIAGNVPVSVAFWVRHALTASGVFEVHVNFGADLANQEVFIARNTTGQAYFEFGGGAGAATGTTTLAAKTWYHICAVYTGAATVLYVNGVQEATTAYSSANIGVTQASFGAYLNAAVYKLEMAGLLDDIRIYTRALPANEVWSLYDRSTRWQLRWQPNRTARLFKQGNPLGSQAPWIHNVITNQAVNTAATY